MALSGYGHKCGKRNGGIKSIAVAGVNAIDSVRMSSGGSVEEIVMKNNERFALYHFKEDNAVYTEKCTCDKGITSVEHTLSFFLEKNGNESARTVEELTECAAEGVVALITTQNEGALILGYSQKFELEFPLRIVSNTGSTGSKITDAAGETITMWSFDASKALSYTGKIPL